MAGGNNIIAICWINTNLFNHQQIMSIPLANISIFEKFHSVRIQLFCLKQHSWKYHFTVPLIISSDATSWGTWFKKLYQYKMKWERKDKERRRGRKKALYPTNIEPMISWVSALEVCALPLCYNHCPLIPITFSLSCVTLISMICSNVGLCCWPV